MPKSKNPTVGSGADGSLSTACTSCCRKETSSSSRPGASRKRDSRSSDEVAESASASEAADSKSSRKAKDGRPTASSNTDQSIDITTEVVGVLAHQLVEGAETLLRSKPAASERRSLPVDPFPLFRGLTDLRPGSPGNGLSGKPLGAAVAGELVQKGVGRRVVRLARIAHHTDSARKEDEEIQIAVHGRAVQMPCAQHLRPQHPFESLPTLVAQCAVRQHAHAVDHAPERWQGPHPSLPAFHRWRRRRSHPPVPPVPSRHAPEARQSPPRPRHPAGGAR